LIDAIYFEKNENEVRNLVARLSICRMEYYV